MVLFLHFFLFYYHRKTASVQFSITYSLASVNGGVENHALKGAKQAEVLLKTLNLYKDEEIKLITTAISRHSDKQAIHEPYDELLKDADVMSHCFYNPGFPVAEWEMERYKNLLIELGYNPDR
jgi:uncharacterized protein